MHEDFGIIQNICKYLLYDFLDPNCANTPNSHATMCTSNFERNKVLSIIKALYSSNTKINGV